MSRSKRTYSQCSFQIQPTECKRLLGCYSRTVLSRFPPVSPSKFSPLLRRLLTFPRNTPSYSASNAGNVFGIACPFNRYRLYSGFLSISKITLIGHVACFPTTTTLTQYASFAPDLPCLDTSALSSTRAVPAVSSKSRQFLPLTIVWMPSYDNPCIKRKFLSLSDSSSIPCLAISLLFNSVSSRISDPSV